MTDCGCTNFPASLGNVTFGASVGIGTADPAAPLVVVGTGASLVGSAGVVADHAGASTDRVRLALGNTNAAVAPGATSRSTELMFYGSNAGGTALQPMFELGTDAEQAGTQSLYVYDDVARAFRLYLGPTGNFGVGTMTPGAKLVVSGLGSSQVEQGSATTAADLFGSTTDRVRLAVGNINAGTAQGATSRSAEFQFYGSNPAGTALQPMFELGTDAEKTGTQSLFVYDDVAKAYRLYLGSTGNFGIGTTAPTAALHVKQDAANVLALVDAAADAESSQLALGAAGELIWQIYKPACSHDLRFARSGVGDQLTIQDGTGNVGIGTNAPASLLHLAAASGAAWPGITVQGANAASGVNALMAKNDAGQQFNVGVGGSANPTVVDKFLVFDQNAGLFRLVIDTAGNMGVGTTNPGYPLDVNGTVRCNGILLGGSVVLPVPGLGLRSNDGARTVVDTDGCYYAS